MGSLRTFEMTLDNDDRLPRKEKNLALQITNKNDDEDTGEDDTDITESVVLITRNLASVMKKINLRSGKGFQQQNISGSTQRGNTISKFRQNSEQQNNQTTNKLKKSIGGVHPMNSTNPHSSI